MSGPSHGACRLTRLRKEDDAVQNTRPCHAQRGGEAQWQQHPTLEAGCSRSTRTGQGDSVLVRASTGIRTQMSCQNVPP